jgi:hypothetical protein
VTVASDWKAKARARHRYEAVIYLIGCGLAVSMYAARDWFELRWWEAWTCLPVAVICVLAAGGSLVLAAKTGGSDA